MKTLSVRQPWAWCIVNGYKQLENRTRDTKVRGMVMIHAGKQLDIAGVRWVNEHFPEIILPTFAEGINMGGIVGMAEIIGTREGIGPIVPEIARWFMPAPKHRKSFVWLLASSAPLPFMPCKGKLGFFNVDYDWSAS